MIIVYIRINQNKDVYSFRVDNHGKRIICAGVSVLTLNTVNSIKAFTDENFTVDYNREGGFLSFESPTLKNNERQSAVALLLNSFYLGIRGIKKEYPEDILLVVETNNTR